MPGLRPSTVPWIPSAEGTSCAARQSLAPLRRGELSPEVTEGYPPTPGSALPRGEAACLLAFPRSGDGCRAKPCLARRGTGSRAAALDNPAFLFRRDRLRRTHMVSMVVVYPRGKRKSMRPDSLWTNPLDCPFGKWGARIPRSWGAGWLFLCLALHQRARLIHFPNGRGICLSFVWPPCRAAWVSSSFRLQEEL